MLVCPMCAEEISAADASCPHCGSAIGNPAPAPRRTTADAGSAPAIDGGSRRRRAAIALAVGAAIVFGTIVAVLMLRHDPSSTSHDRSESIRRAQAAAARGDWSSAIDELNAAAVVSPLSPDEEKLRESWEFRRVLGIYCAGKADDLTVSDLYQIPAIAPPGLDTSTSAKARELLARRSLIQQVRELRKRQSELSRTASEEPRFDEQCETAVNAVQTARTVSLMIVRKLDTDYGPGIYEVQDATGRTAHLTTTDTTFTTMGWTTITAYAFDDVNIIELSAAHRAKAQECLADRQQAATARAEFATSSQQLDAKISAMSREFIASCASANVLTSPTPTAQITPVTPDAARPYDPRTTATPAAPPPTTAEPAHVTADAIKALIGAQISSLSRADSGFADTFDEGATAWFPDALDMAKGRVSIAAHARASWGQPTKIESGAPIVGVHEDVGWATAQWKVTTTSGSVIAVRVTEVFATRPAGLRVIAASFSVAPSRGSAGFKVDAPATGDDYPNDFDGPPAQWLGTPAELTKNLRDDPATTLVGSDANEVALGPAEVQKLLLGWRKLSLSPLGAEVGVAEEANYAIYTGVLRTPGAHPFAYQTLALFTRRGPEDRFLLAAAHFSAPQRR